MSGDIDDPEITQSGPYFFNKKVAEQFLSAIERNEPIRPPTEFVPDRKPVGSEIPSGKFVTVWDRDSLLQAAAACISCARLIQPGRNNEQAEAIADDNFTIVSCFADFTAMVANCDYEFDPQQECKVVTGPTEPYRAVNIVGH